IRRVLVDYARHRNRAKRGGGLEQVTLAEAEDLALERAPDMVALDEALTQLETLDPRKAAVVELRFFGGLTTDEIARHLSVSPGAVGRGGAGGPGQPLAP